MNDFPCCIWRLASDADSKLILIRQSPKWPGVINHARVQLIGQFLSRNERVCVTCHIIPSLKRRGIYQNYTYTLVLRCENFFIPNNGSIVGELDMTHNKTS